MFNMSQTNIFKNWDKVCYIASKLAPTEDIYGNQINQYEEPIKYKFNYQPVVDRKEAEAQGFGDNVNGLVRAMLDIKYLNKIKEFDLVYLYDAVPYNLTEDEVYKEDVVYYKKEANSSFVELVAGTDYEIGDAIENGVYNKESYVGENANYKVVTCKPQNVKILVYFEEIVKNKGGYNNGS